MLFLSVTFLIQGTDGNLYGTTEGGGVFDQGNGVQSHPWGHADDALYILLPSQLHGRR